MPCLSKCVVASCVAGAATTASAFTSPAGLRGRAAVHAPNSATLQIDAAIAQEAAAGTPVCASLALGAALGLSAAAAAASHRTGRRSRAAGVARRQGAVEVQAPTALEMGRVAPPASAEGFGDSVFRGAVAEPYLRKHGLSLETLADPSWCKDQVKSDAMAGAVLEWATDRGATVFCHWFQPMGSAGMRHGQTAMVQISMLSFSADGVPSYQLTGDHLLSGETDGSSYPNGGLRATHSAGAYLKIDPCSPIFLRGDTVFIPACFVAYTGEALDEKTPLLRATEVVSKEGQRLLKHLGLECSGLVNNIGLEQEMFLVDREAYYKRPDLQLAGRTVMGNEAPRGQEMCDHYMGPLSSATPALKCIQEIQEECFKMGIPLKTRHREVAPNQYEFAPLFGPAPVQTDQNLMVMQVAEEVAAKHGLACLLNEKPFAGVNGSGKHNNWSLATNEGVQLLKPKAINEATGNPEAFPVVMAALVSGIDKHGDLMRMAIASPGNDFRLGACEAPPAVMSTYLGEDMTAYLQKFMDGESSEYTPKTTELSFGVSSVAPIEIPAEDRNRTSPFPYGGARFEFRAAGSSQNVSLINTVLCTLAAEGFKVISDRVEAGEKAADVARDLLKQHSKCIFNGNGYDPAWPEEAEEKGIWRIDSGVEAMCRMSADKNKQLFSDMGIFTDAECEAREAVLLEHYKGTVEIECKTMIEMIHQHVIPAAKNAGVDRVAALTAEAERLSSSLSAMLAAGTPLEAARLARTLRLETMEEARKVCDETEALVPPALWTLASYRDLLFLDTHKNATH
ncbi:unnamed protein product [Prorocentrum cordatum]|uniref:GS catalytic domain-containing protein n=1 Tax=Prorocentrum cordatum TaxID=2364126 RepID=A0ABN9TS16_9DINO|nr:unnamed protein product [Polarella glacialis]